MDIAHKGGDVNYVMEVGELYNLHYVQRHALNTCTIAYIGCICEHKQRESKHQEQIT